MSQAALQEECDADESLVTGVVQLQERVKGYCGRFGDLRACQGSECHMVLFTACDELRDVLKNLGFTIADK